jgi:hypothetical protein
VVYKRRVGVRKKGARRFQKKKGESISRIPFEGRVADIRHLLCTHRDLGQHDEERPCARRGVLSLNDDHLGIPKKLIYRRYKLIYKNVVVVAIVVTVHLIDIWGISCVLLMMHIVFCLEV